MSGFAAFGFHDGEGGFADRLVRAADELRSSADGLVSVRVHREIGGGAVVTRIEWADEAAANRAVLPEALAAGIRFRGHADVGITGPAVDTPPGLIAVAVRHVSSREGAMALAGLLRETGEWKGNSPGFISATPYIGADGRSYVNYPQWTDRAAFEAYMADGRIPAGQEAVARFEVAPPEFTLCTLAVEFAGPVMPGRHR